MPDRISKFIAELQSAPTMDDVFNPWHDVDAAHDQNSRAPMIRARQLKHYLSQRTGARYLLIAEALGYQGGHFTGIAMTSERLLLGHLAGRGINPDHLLPGLTGQRTSSPALNRNGFAEPTASIVWQTAIVELGLAPTEFVLWNVFPWHPYCPKAGMLSNRTPKTSELQAAVPYLQRFMKLFSARRIISIGRKAEASLAGLGIEANTVRHPAHGGASAFRRQFSAAVND